MVSNRSASLEQLLLRANGEALLALNQQPYPYESFVGPRRACRASHAVQRVDALTTFVQTQVKAGVACLHPPLTAAGLCRVY